MIDSQEARMQLPESAKAMFDDIVQSRILGASKQTSLISQMLLSIINNDNNTNEDIICKVNTVATYFKETRGQNSRAIYNAISEMLQLISNVCSRKMSKAEYKSQMTGVLKDYQKLLDANQLKSAKYAAALAESMDTILIFDYSSTVNDFIIQLNGKKTIYIPESRALNGGRPFLKDAVIKGHDVHFIPDTATMVELRKCDAAFMGAETLYPDGSVFNSIGADILAVLCAELGVPLYVISPMIKTDSRSVYGYNRLEPMKYDYSARLAEGWEDSEKQGIDFKGIKLVKISGQKIKGIITENGIVPPNAFFGVSMKYCMGLEETGNA